MMKTKKKAVFNWSGGKDSALALYKALQSEEFEIVALLTTVTGTTMRSSIHGIPLDILKEQAQSIGIPLYTIELPSNDMTDYEDNMRKAVVHFKEEGVTHFIFGDIFLYDIKKYRESKLNPYDIEVVEPLWNKTSKQVVEEFLESGIRSKVIVTLASKLDNTYIGRELDRDYFSSLPQDVDLCGEEGEYHTLAYAGPLFKKDISYKLEAPHFVSYDIALDDGTTKNYGYWITTINIA